MPRKTVRLPREVFLSHASPDRATAKCLAATLRAHAVPVWFSETNVVGAQQWHDEIGKALRRCDWFGLLLSVHAVRSAWVKRELLFALNDRRYEGRIVPMVVKPCAWVKLWTLGALQFVDFGNYEAGCRALLTVWGVGLERQRLVRPAAASRRGGTR
jgi:hypothetical protein